MSSYLTAGEIVEATRGRLLQGTTHVNISTVSTDTRTLREGDLFIALRGPHFDGHAFVSQAFLKGARGAIVSSIPPATFDHPQLLIQVDDTLSALGEIARLWRRHHPIPLVAITGSAGKTTTKEWTSLVLGRRYRVLSSPGTNNNLIGVPLAVLGLGEDHQVAVLELGMSAAGEIRRLSQICQPDVGVITNIGAAHLEFLGSLQGVAAAKAEMIEFLGGERTCILNGDDPHLLALMEKIPGKSITYGLSSRRDLFGSGVVSGKEGTKFQMVYGDERTWVHLPLWGTHNVYNALAAAAAGIACGLTLREIEAGLSLAFQPSMRLERVLLPGEIVLLNDAYNANPISMKAALNTFFEMKGEARGILVLGDMLELGSHGEGLHREMGAYISSCPQVGALIAVGSLSRALAEESQKRGFSAPVFLCEDQREACRILKQNLKSGDWVLLKGSRAMKMEKVLEDIH
jgi:UDP-N-acetylmuramoyl-tripeptide--D-alanyl-D-alanine ligase